MKFQGASSETVWTWVEFKDTEGPQGHVRSEILKKVREFKPRWRFVGISLNGLVLNPDGFWVILTLLVKPSY